MTEFVHRHAPVSGIRLHYVEAGTGPLVILLHGFPEFWFSWRHQIPALAQAGFRVIAPDLRGYNESDKPAGISSYRLDLLVADVVGLIQQAGCQRATLVGHDWGGGIAWQTAIMRPELVERLIVLNAPHPAAFFREMRHWAQLRKSWYIFFFQLPWLPEYWLRRNNLGFIDQTLGANPLRPGTFTPADIARYKEVFSPTGALTAAINYYRAAFRMSLRQRMPKPHMLEVPTLVIWGEEDSYLGTGLLDGLDAWVRCLRIERLPGVTHWVQNEAPERVNELMIEFLRSVRIAASPNGI